MSTSTGKLTLVDLAGSERASETNNRGRQLRDGAAINRYAQQVCQGLVSGSEAGPAYPGSIVRALVHRTITPG